ncbi:hypothetical protein ACU686_01020 [Yinghuangia aomiensis]
MRNATALVRLFLFVILAVGTVGMHTVGHPPEARAEAAMAADPMAGPHAPQAPDAPCPGSHCAAGGPAAAEHRNTADHNSPARHPGMDPASVCLAIALAGFVLAVTLLALRRGAARRTAPLRARGVGPGDLRPAPAAAPRPLPARDPADLGRPVSAGSGLPVTRSRPRHRAAQPSAAPPRGVRHGSTSHHEAPYAARSRAVRRRPVRRARPRRLRQRRRQRRARTRATSPSRLPPRPPHRRAPPGSTTPT